jgi:acetyl esterase/lipase
MFRLLITFVVWSLLIAGTSVASDSDAATQPSPIVVPLWDHGVPNAAKNPGPERDDGTGRIWNVSVPGMLVYLPKDDGKARHMAIIFCPGGSYTHLTRLEGADGFVMEFLPRGVAVISLKYRLRPASKDVERDALDDAQQAIRLTRSNADAWGIDSKRIGLIGASAGGNVVLNVVSHGDKSAQPDFVGMLSPWPDGNAIEAYPIGKDAPPGFIASARDDKTAPTTFAEGIAAGYESARIAHQFWQIDTGGHGAFTLGGAGEGAHWPEQFWKWLQQIGIAK